MPRRLVDYGLLYALERTVEQDGCVTDFVKHLDQSRESAEAYLLQLEADGYVYFEGEGRRKLVRLTMKGEETLELLRVVRMNA